MLPALVPPPAPPLAKTEEATKPFEKIIRGCREGESSPSLTEKPPRSTRAHTRPVQVESCPSNAEADSSRLHFENVWDDFESAVGDLVAKKRVLRWKNQKRRRMIRSKPTGTFRRYKEEEITRRRPSPRRMGTRLSGCEGFRRRSAGCEGTCRISHGHRRKGNNKF